MQFSIGNGHLQGRYRWAVLNADGSVANRGTLMPDEPSSNLILDQGVDNIDSYPVASLFENCAVGTGTSTPAVTQVELDNEKARTNNLSGDTSLHGTTFPSDGASPYTLIMARGFDFPKGSLDSSTDGDYTEVGFSQSSSAGQNLFSRALLKDGSGNTISVTVASDQILRIAYELDVTLDPSSQTTGTVDITNIGTIGYTAIGGTSSESISYVKSDGNTRTSSFCYGFEPSENLSTKAGGLDTRDPSLGVGFRNGGVGNNLDEPEAITSTRTKTYKGGGVWEFQVTWGTDQGNLSSIKNILFAVWPNNSGGFTVRFRIDDGDEFTKDSTHELVLTFEVTYTAN